MKYTKALLAGILAGLTAPGALAQTPPKYQRPEGSDLQRLRNDVNQVGESFSKVIAREYGKAAK